MNGRNSGFTLIEILIAVAILGILVTLLSGNFLTSLKKGKDARRKADLKNITGALEMYYEDQGAYPPDTVLQNTQLCAPDDSEYVDGCDRKVYMHKIPKDPAKNFTYYYKTDDQSQYQLYSCLENELDRGEGVNQNGWLNGGECLCGITGCKFKIESPNSTAQ